MDGDCPIGGCAGHDQAVLVWRELDRVHTRLVVESVDGGPLVGCVLPVDDDLGVISAGRQQVSKAWVRPLHRPHRSVVPPEL